MKGLYLDDCRTPQPTHGLEWHIVRSYGEFVAYVEENGVPELISFDHDLAPEHYAPPHVWGEKYAGWVAEQRFAEKTGMQAAEWLKEYCLDMGEQLRAFTVHSANPEGAEQILTLLNNFMRQCGQQPTGYRTVW
jgi:hypothetical protein